VFGHAAPRLEEDDLAGFYGTATSGGKSPSDVAPGGRTPSDVAPGGKGLSNAAPGG